MSDPYKDQALLKCAASLLCVALCAIILGSWISGFIFCVMLQPLYGWALIGVGATVFVPFYFLASWIEA
jgi:hypothetical protein